MLAASALGLLAIGGVLLVRGFAPPPVRFESIEVVNDRVTDDELLFVKATTPRQEIPGCINGVQIDLKDDIGNILRLPIPAREVGRDTSEYAVVIPQGTTPGRYQMKVREIFTCKDRIEAVEAPWVPVEIVP